MFAKVLCGSQGKQGNWLDLVTTAIRMVRKGIKDHQCVYKKKYQTNSLDDQVPLYSVNSGPSEPAPAKTLPKDLNSFIDVP